ncbi:MULTISPECIES: S24 family peptidase [unclassified Halomonas]|uniref:LexA family protein n=1 Tax=unclassified Halomonas TaxID=2609666 RepID=UPI0020766D4C|nr:MULTISPECIES: S24 family peptidase [unclassified Halomonas]
MIASRPIEPATASRVAACPRGPALKRVTGEQREVTRRNTYALRVRGHRMQQYNLFDGDVIVIHRQQRGGHREVATATINQREIALKELAISRLGVRLCAEGEAMPSVFLHNSDIQVLGMVMGVESPAAAARRH